MYAEAREAAEEAKAAFVTKYEVKYLKSVEPLRHDEEQLLTFF